MKSRVKAKSRAKAKSRVKAKSSSKRKASVRAKSKAPPSRKSAQPRVASSKAAKPAKPSRTPSRKADPLDQWIVAGAAALGLPVEKAWMRAVRTNLQVTLDQAAPVAEFPLPDDAEPAPVFRA
jgi:hypothetical protein